AACFGLFNGIAARESTLANRSSARSAPMPSAVIVVPTRSASAFTDGGDTGSGGLRRRSRTYSKQSSAIRSASASKANICRLLQHGRAEFGEHLRHLRSQVLAVGARQLVHAGAIPARRGVVGGRLAAERQWRDLGIPRGVEEQWERQPVVLRIVPHAMR